MGSICLCRTMVPDWNLKINAYNNLTHDAWSQLASCMNSQIAIMQYNSMSSGNIYGLQGLFCKSSVCHFLNNLDISTWLPLLNAQNVGSNVLSTSEYCRPALVWLHLFFIVDHLRTLAASAGPPLHLKDLLLINYKRA